MGSTLFISLSENLSRSASQSKFSRTVGAVHEIAASDLPFVTNLLVALQHRVATGESVQSGALLFGLHQPQLVVLPMKG